jgi:GDP-D-mannose dehydratase
MPRCPSRDWHEEAVRLFLHHADLSESSRLVRLVYEIQPGSSGVSPDPAPRRS